MMVPYHGKSCDFVAATGKSVPAMAACLCVSLLIGCQAAAHPLPAKEATPGMLHLEVVNELHNPSKLTAAGDLDHSFHVRVLVDGVKKIDGVYPSDGVYNPARFDLALSAVPHAITVEVPDETACTFGVLPTQPVWAHVLFGYGFGENSHKPFVTYTTSDHQEPAF